MPLSFERLRGTHNARMKVRGHDPLVVVTGEDTSLLAVIEHSRGPVGSACIVERSIHDHDQQGLRYSVLELLFAPCLAVDASARDQLLLGCVINPQIFTVAWRALIQDGFDTSQRRSFDSLWSEVVQWAEGRAVSDALTLADTDLMEVADVADDMGWPAGSDAEWCKHITVGSLGSQTKCMGRRALLLGMLGPRNLLVDRNDTSELLEIASLICREYNAVNSGSASLSMRFKVPRMVAWVALERVDELFFDPELLVVDDTRLDATVNLFEADKLQNKDANKLVLLHLPRVLGRFAEISSFVGARVGPAVVEALSLLADKLCRHRYSGVLTQEALKAVDEELATWKDTFAAESVSEMSAKLALTLTSVKRAGGAGPRGHEFSESSDGSSKSDSIRKVVKSKVFLDTVDAMEKLLQAKDVNTLDLFHKIFQSGCGLLIKHIVGLKDFSAHHPVLAGAAIHRIAKFETDKLRPIARSMAEVILPRVVDSDGKQAVDPLLAGWYFDESFVHSLLVGDWHKIDFPKHLVLEIRSKTHDEKFAHRTKGAWYFSTGQSEQSDKRLQFTVSTMLEELASRMELLFCQFLPYKAKQTNGVESVVQLLRDAVDLAGAVPMMEDSVLESANQYIMDALYDAGTQWATFWSSTQPNMEPPQCFLPAISSCKVDLDHSMENARDMRFTKKANPKFYHKLSLVTPTDAFALMTQSY